MPCGKNLELIEQKFGKLTIVRRLPERSKYKHCLWECSCDCGNIRSYNTSDLRKKLKASRVSCGCQYYRDDTGAVVISGLYSRLRHRHREKTTAPVISFEEYKRITQLNCYYCGCPPSNIQFSPKNKIPIRYNGLDRIDSSLGYELGNVRPSCKRCNIAKSDMSEIEFIRLIRQIATRLTSQYDADHFQLPDQPTT